MSHRRFSLFASASLTALAFLLPPASEAGPCVSGCNQVEVACRFEARHIAEMTKAACVTDRLACTEQCEEGISGCLSGCASDGAACSAECELLERRSQRRRCLRICDRAVPKCDRQCRRGDFQTCDTQCRLTRRACVGAAVADLKGIRPICTAANAECIDTCAEVTERRCVRRCERQGLSCYKTAKDVKEACFHQCFINDAAPPDCKGQCRAINVESNDICTDDLFACFEACGP